MASNVASIWSADRREEVLAHASSGIGTQRRDEHQRSDQVRATRAEIDEENSTHRDPHEMSGIDLSGGEHGRRIVCHVRQHITGASVPGQSVSRGSYRMTRHPPARSRSVNRVG
jgi:hypothetical protein